MTADGKHARIDGFVSLGVVASAFFVALGLQIADPIIGLAITIVILKITWDSWHTVRHAEIDLNHIDEDDGEHPVPGSADLNRHLRTGKDRIRPAGRVELHGHGGDWLQDVVFGLNDGVVTTLLFRDRREWRCGLANRSGRDGRARRRVGSR